MRFGERVRALRKYHDITLRDLADAARVDPGNLSRIERRRFDPPRDRETLERMATALKLRPGSDEWQEFIDAAYADAGRVPDDLINDDELRDLVLAKLPAMFRTLRNQVQTEKQQTELFKIASQE